MSASVPVKILFISADPSLTLPVNECLLEVGFNVLCVSHGMGALDLIRSEKPALIILDMVLPDFSSLAILRSLREDNGHGRIPVILMGASMREEDVLIGLEVGADVCLVEAFHPQVFVARVRSVLRRIEQAKAR